LPDQRHHRGPHPEDRELFSSDAVPSLHSAASDLSWLLTRGYASPGALKLVGDRYTLDRELGRGGLVDVLEDEQQIRGGARAGLERQHVLPVVRDPRDTGPVEPLHRSGGSVPRDHDHLLTPVAQGEEDPAVAAHVVDQQATRAAVHQPWSAAMAGGPDRGELGGQRPAHQDLPSPGVPRQPEGVVVQRTPDLGLPLAVDDPHLAGAVTRARVVHERHPIACG
jgi:hypothetical protein